MKSICENRDLPSAEPLSQDEIINTKEVPMLKKLTVLFGLCSLFFSLPTLAKENKTQLPVLMHSFYNTLQELRPYMNSEEDFKNPKNQAKIKALLKGLESRVDDNQIKELSNKSGFGITYGLLGRHLKETNYLYEKEIYGAAQNNLKATTGFCIACHDRLPKPTAQESGPVVGKTKSQDNLVDAEFYYLAHQFDKALMVYDSLIQQYDDKKKNIDLDQIYKRKIAYFSRIQRNPEAAMASLKLDLTNTHLPLETKQNLKDWIHYFDLWSKEGKSDPAKLSDQGLLDYARTEIEKNTGGRRIAVSDPYVVNLLRVSGLLYERVFKKPTSPQTAELLYLLAKCERDLSPLQNYSLADLYLKECVMQYPKNPIAKKCFADYELAMKQKLPNGMSEYINSSIEALRRVLE